MKHIHVAAAVIRKENQIFATARGYGSYKGQWEFPGGKIESGESPQEALRREISEELATEIEVGGLAGLVEYDYPEFHITLECYWCTVVKGNLELLEAEAARWLTKEELFSVDWLPADRAVVEKIEDKM